jgi:2-polyprenyl-3-methyl-5-hydroxy-6-metoxy-1,4-benzoquinol methylase
MTLNDPPIEKLQRCPLCDGSRLKQWRNGRDRIHRISTSTFIYSRCTSCSLIFLSERPTEAAIGSFYPPNYGPYRPDAASAPGGTPNGTRAVTSGRSIRDRLVAVLRFGNAAMARLLKDGDTAGVELIAPTRPGAEFLDFGCGSDRFLNRARSLGWATTGMDFNPQTVDLVRQSGHKGVWVSETGWLELQDETFDLVRMNHVLEHLYHPIETLALLNRKMRRGARLEIAVPNPSGLSSRMFGSRWHSLDCPRHLVLLRPDVLQKLLETVGFRVDSVSHEILTKDIARSLGHLLHDYRLIRHSDIELIQYNPLLSELLGTPAMLVAKLRLADRFSVVAVKP